MHPPSTSQESPKYLPLSDPFLPLYLIISASIQTCYFSQEEKQTRTKTKLKHSLWLQLVLPGTALLLCSTFIEKLQFLTPHSLQKTKTFTLIFLSSSWAVSFLRLFFNLFLKHHYFSWLCSILLNIPPQYLLLSPTISTTSKCWNAPGFSLLTVLIY